MPFPLRHDRPVADHPLNRGLWSWHLATPYNRGLVYRDLCRRSHGALTSMTPADWRGPQGRPSGWGALNFDGAADNVSCTVPSLAAHPFTLSCWCRVDVDNAQTQAVAVGVGSGSTVYWCIGWGTDSTNLAPVIVARNTTNRRTLASGTYALGQWVHLVGVFLDDTNRLLYVNGAFNTGTAVTSVTAPAGVTQLRIGAGPSASNLLPGMVDDVRYYPARGLTNGDCAELYHQACHNYPNLLRRAVRRTYSAPAGGAAYTLTADAGSYTITGTAATLKYGRLLAAGAGAYALTGTAASLLHGYALAAGAGSYALSGTAATLRAARMLAAASGAYAVTGTAAGLPAGRVLSAAAGTYTVNGTDATLIHGTPGAYTLAADAGAYAVTGTAAALKYGRLLGAGAGSYAVTGAAAGLLAGHALAASAGAYAVTGAAATLTYTPVVPPTVEPWRVIPGLTAEPPDRPARPASAPSRGYPAAPPSHDLTAE